MICGFTGTRYGPTPEQYKAMQEFLSRIPMSRFVHGAAHGADTLAHYIVRAAHGDIPIELHPSDRPSTLVTVPIGNVDIHDQKPPLERNRIIVQRIHGLLAVPREDEEITRSGTWATIRYARELGVPIYMVKQCGKVVRA